MQTTTHYPPSPRDIPENFTKANATYKRHAWLAMAGLMLFMLIYIALMLGFAFITYQGVMAFNEGRADLWQGIITVSAMLLTVFMAKSLFAVRRAGDTGGIEVNSADEPKLFEFLHTLADEIGAPKPHRVFITPEVNAAVFYDLSLLNLFFPSRKNLIIGLGLVNVLNLGELKAVLAHEFGHFAQGSMLVGRWVYIAHQIISHMVSTRDWLDSIVRFVSRIDLRVAWLGWILMVILWSIRSLMDTLFRLVLLAERALSREMEFNADLVAVSVTGSDALINALHKLQAADEAWQTTLQIASSEAGSGNMLEDLFHAQQATIDEMRKVLNDKQYGDIPEKPADITPEAHRVFNEETARPPQMWSTHPMNRDREDNAKSIYIAAEIDNRNAWEIFADPDDLKKRLSRSIYKTDSLGNLKIQSPLEAVVSRFKKASYSPEYRGAYLGRSPVRNFATVEEILQAGSVCATAPESVAKIYPEAIIEDLELARNLDIERDTLQALERGDLKPSGGVIRYRGKEIQKNAIPDALKMVAEERKAVAENLKAHDACCRRAHLQIAEHFGNKWKEYLLSLIELLHCSEHMAARVDDERALFVNTWMVITADGSIGYFEKRRMIKVCQNLHKIMTEISERATDIKLPPSIAEAIGVDNWAEQCPEFSLIDVTTNNWMEWCQAASPALDNMVYALNLVKSATLEEMIKTEAKLRRHLEENTKPEAAPEAGSCPSQYPILLPGNENVLQHKLDLWNRFQLAHGFIPTSARLLVSLTIVGGTIFGGIAIFIGGLY